LNKNAKGELKMIEENKVHNLTRDPKDVPIPVLNFTRWIYFIILVSGIILQKPWETTMLLVLLFPVVLFGKKWNIIGRFGKKLLASKIPGSLYEDRRLIQFNNTLLVIMLILAQIAFITGNIVIGWLITSMAIAATGLALAGYCVGCFLYYKFKLYKYRFLANI
jgi:Domain of unknown function (DUF4395)